MDSNLFNIDRSTYTVVKGGQTLTIEMIENAVIHAHRAGLSEQADVYRWYEYWLKKYGLK